ncbi:POLA1 [Acanthosepion pharaonis]|uniref:DNA-directed DNA polymerase n=1 Tax=Acanthosepion pharaonis TaxID=158019 RepID=A0A812CA40_ACAPH|nr:POLA1 [Sepia pharaonis]
MAPPEQNDAAVTSSGRTKREKVDKFGRFAALARLKKAKESGEKHKYEFEEEKDVYDVVDEDEYSEMVRQRREEDWIVDDNGVGYVEDGREIFDDDLADDAFHEVSKGKKSAGKKNQNIHHPDRKPKKNIRNMFLDLSGQKKKEKDVSIQEDDLLSDIMGEIHQGPTNLHLGSFKKSTPVSSGKKVNRNPFSVSTVTPTKPKPSLKPRNIITASNNNEDEPVLPAAKKPRREMPEEDLEYVAVPIGKIEREEVKEKNGEKENISEIEMTEIEEKDADTTDMDLTDINFDEDVEEENPESKMSVECLESGWDTVSKTKDNSSDEPPVLDMQVDASQLPLITNENGDQVLRFYWLDAYEDFFHQKGIVYLFGKVWFESVKSFASCCVSVKNIERRIRVLPRGARLNPKTKIEDGLPVKLADVYEEFSEKVADKYKITTYKSRKVTCKYAFELEGIPAESDYLEVRYSYDMQMLPNDLQGETFSHIFGTNTSGLEILLLDRQMKGPCWLDLKNPQVPNPPFSWCKVEATIKNLVDLTVVKEPLPIPPLVVMTLNLRTLPNPKTHQNEVIAAAYLVNNAFAIDKPPPTKKIFHHDWCAISKPTDCIFPFDFKNKLQKNKNMKVEVSPTERALLGFLLAKIHKVDPDVIVGHDIYGFDIDILLNRITANKIPHWSKIGRLKRSTVPKLSGGRGSSAEKAAACGRLICDVKISANELVHLKSYELSELTQQILKGKRISVDQDHIKDMYNSSANLMKLIEFTLMDCSYILRIMYELNVLPLALQITSICGNVMSRTLMGGRSERNEYLLLHAFTEKDYIVPDKQFKKKPVPVTEFDEDGDPISDKKSSGRKKPAYAGGLVLEPKKGFYDKYILLLDFNSLYPSIIQEYNICFTTVVQQHSSKISFIFLLNSFLFFISFLFLFSFFSFSFFSFFFFSFLSFFFFLFFFLSFLFLSFLFSFFLSFLFFLSFFFFFLFFLFFSFFSFSFFSFFFFSFLSFFFFFLFFFLSFLFLSFLFLSFLFLSFLFLSFLFLSFLFLSFLFLSFLFLSFFSSFFFLSFFFLFFFFLSFLFLSFLFSFFSFLSFSFSFFSFSFFFFFLFFFSFFFSFLFSFFSFLFFLFSFSFFSFFFFSFFFFFFFLFFFLFFFSFFLSFFFLFSFLFFFFLFFSFFLFFLFFFFLFFFFLFFSFFLFSFFFFSFFFLFFFSFFFFFFLCFSFFFFSFLFFFFSFFFSFSFFFFFFFSFLFFLCFSFFFFFFFFLSFFFSFSFFSFSFFSFSFLFLCFFSFFFSFFFVFFFFLFFFLFFSFFSFSLFFFFLFSFFSLFSFFFFFFFVFFFFCFLFSFFLFFFCFLFLFSFFSFFFHFSFSLFSFSLFSFFFVFFFFVFFFLFLVFFFFVFFFFVSFSLFSFFFVFFSLFSFFLFLFLFSLFSFFFVFFFLCFLFSLFSFFFVFFFLCFLFFFVFFFLCFSFSLFFFFFVFLFLCFSFSLFFFVFSFSLFFFFFVFLFSLFFFFFVFFFLFVFLCFSFFCFFSFFFFFFFLFFFLFFFFLFFLSNCPNFNAVFSV